MSTPRIILSFDHRTCDASVDINLPMPDPINVSAEEQADRVCPACPICKAPMRYIGFSFSKDDDE